MELYFVCVIVTVFYSFKICLTIFVRIYDLLPQTLCIKRNGAATLELAWSTSGQ